MWNVPGRFWGPEFLDMIPQSFEMKEWGIINFILLKVSYFLMGKYWKIVIYKYWCYASSDRSITAMRDERL